MSVFPITTFGFMRMPMLEPIAYQHAYRYEVRDAPELPRSIPIPESRNANTMIPETRQDTDHYERVDQDAIRSVLPEQLYGSDVQG